MIKFLKKAVKWYFKKSAETYAWTPSCMMPYIKEKEKTV
nr:MAG TPA: hypothetical protein [Caudoviricetes sp.]